MSKIIIGESAGKNIGFDLRTLLRTRLLVQADSGGGKSWLIRVLAEQLFGKVQVILIDPEGEFATLREKFGYVLVGRGGETPADPRSAALVANRLLELNASAVCDLYEMKNHLRHQWVHLFLDAMIDSPKKLWHPVVVVVDEAHVFCPEKGKGESEASQSMIDLCTRGRKRGFCAVWATQRLATLNKDASSMLQNRLIGPTFEDVNRKRAAECLSITKKDEPQFLKEIQLLPVGNFFALGRAIALERILVHIRGVETSHPEMGNGKHAAAVPPPPDKIKSLLPKLADLPKEAEDKARTEADFRREIRELQTKLKAAERAQPAAAPQIADSRVVKTAVEAATRPLLKQVKEFQRLAKAALGAVNHVAIGTAIGNLNQILETDPPETIVQPALTATRPRMSYELLKDMGREDLAIPAPPDIEGITPAQSRIVQAAAAFHAIGIATISKKWLAARAGVSHKSSAYSNNLGALRSRGLLDYRSGDVFLTQAGMDLAGPHAAPLTAAEMADSCKALLTPAQAKIFDVLHSIFPQAMDKGALAEAAGVSPASSAYSNNLGAMRSAGMIDYGAGGTVFMQKWVFLEDAA